MNANLLNLLLLSNSRNPGGEYLAHALEAISELAPGPSRKALFVPFAGVTVTWDDYSERVSAALAPTGITVTAAHHVTDIAAALTGVDLILVGGGNTFNLLRELRSRGWLHRFRADILAGKPYVGWSAGSNLACPTLRTCNDMPIVDPMGFDALGLIPFQINPHFTNELPVGLQAETREQRITEFLTLNPDEGVLGLPEGVWLRVKNGQASIGGHQAAVWFSSGQAARHLEVDFEWSLESKLARTREESTSNTLQANP